MFSKYYQSELTYFRRWAARSAPSIQRSPASQSAVVIPDVERLLEGFASHRPVRERIDDQPEVAWPDGRLLLRTISG